VVLLGDCHWNAHEACSEWLGDPRKKKGPE
jgi:hypothetical protein